jgi:hypothetical protein
MIQKIEFINDYELDPNFEKIKKKTMEVDFNNPSQLYNIIKKRKLYKSWQPSRQNRTKIIRALEMLDTKKN